MDYKKAFYSKLEDCYLGVKIKDFEEGNIAKSGFSNLLQIKEQYFAHIKAYLDSQIEGEPQSHDIYNKLFTFFDSYLNESGTPFFNDTPAYKNIYAKVYSNSKDTSLFYKTQNLYYVKSDTLYQSLTLGDEKQTYEVVFDASEYKQNADNNKNKIIFKFVNVETNDESKAQILIKVSNQKDLFSNLNNVFKQNSNEFSEEFLKDLRQNEILKDSKIKINEEELKKIFRSYKKQAEIDFFIHKNAREFLKEQFDLWMFGYLYKESAIQEWNPEIIAHLQCIKNIAYEVIKLIGDFENELKAVWLKPKFAKKTEYVFSLDKLKPNLMDSITNDKGFESQIKEWQELNLIDEDFNKEDLLSNDTYRYLPIDTKHFSKETKYKLLSSFEDLESVLNGELIKADNFQALNTLMPKYQGKVDLIYIDPPFNTGSDFEYRDKFQDSTWLSLMENRLELARELLSDRGSFYLHLDENADYLGRLLIDNIFESLECKKITFDTNATKDEQADLFGYKSFGNNFALKSSTIFFIKNANSIFNKLWKPNRNTTQLDIGQLDLIAKAKNNSPKKIEDFDYFVENYSNGKLVMKKIELDSEKIYPIGDIWNDIYSFTQSEMRVSENISFYSSQKPENMLRRIIQSSSNQGNIVLDFFTGSGTTLAVAQKLGRKWLDVEMGEHFYEKYTAYNKENKQDEYRLGLLGRMKNVVAGDKDFFAIDKKRRSHLSKSLNYQGSGAFRYYELESYEEALSHCEYVLKDSQASLRGSKADEASVANVTDPYLQIHNTRLSGNSKIIDCHEANASRNDNEIYKGKDYAKAKTILDYRKSRKLIDKLHKGESVCLDMHTGYREGFDIFHTMANLMGWKIKRLFLDSKGIESCEFDNGEILNLDSIDLAKYPKLKNLIWWE